METKTCKECGRELELSNFKKTRWGGVCSICNQCSVKKSNDTKRRILFKEREKGLGQYTPRELMEELARRGYKGKLTYTRVEEIDITNF